MVDGGSPPLLLLMGVSGCGKTTTAQRLSRILGWPFRDGDTFHPEANIAKMSRGEPLNDEDRWPWLDAIGAWMDEQSAAGASGIVTCSALRRVYRHRLLDKRPQVQLVYLKGPKPLIAERMARRKNHFMPPALLDSQFAALEEPRGAERPIIVNIALPPNRVVDHVLLRAGLMQHRRADASRQSGEKA